MFAPTSTLPVESDPSAAVRLRDRILAAFLVDRSTILTLRDDVLASLRLSSGVQIVLIACPADASPPTLRPMFDAIIRDTTAGVVHLVAVGGGDLVERELKRCAPFWQLERRFGFHHVDLTGKVERVTGVALRQLKQAVADAPPTGLPEEEVASLLAQGSPLHAAEARLDTALRGRFPWVTIALGAICVVLFALGKSWQEGNNSIVLYRMGANSGPDVKDGEVWRLLASAFLHADVGHLLVNMVALAGFGLALEGLLGPRRYIMLYGLSALGGGLASAILRDPGLAVGASGAIWGLMAAGVGLAILPRGLLPPLRLEQARRRAALPLVINILYSFAPGIDLHAHFGGGLVGLILMLTGIITRGLNPAWTEGSAVVPQERSSVGLTLGALAISVVLIGSVVMALAVGRPWQSGEPPVLTRVQVADTGITVELPTVIAGSPVDENKERARILTFGTFKTAPVAVELVIVTLTQVVLPEQIAEAMPLVLKDAQENDPLGAQRQGDAEIMSVGDRPFVTTTHHINNLVLRSWVSIFGDREIVLRVYSLPDRPAAWAGIEDKIVASLQIR